jgi:hypothetical protein
LSASWSRAKVGITLRKVAEVDQAAAHAGFLKKKWDERQRIAWDPKATSFGKTNAVRYISQATAGGMYPAPFFLHKQLQMLNLFGTKVTDKGKAELKKALPKLEIGE